MKLVPGLYEQLITIGLEKTVAAAYDTAVERELLNHEAAPHILARYLHDSLVRALRTVSGEEPLAQQVGLANRDLRLLGEAAPNAGIDEDEIVRDPAEML